jgi:hypothetical protein
MVSNYQNSDVIFAEAEQKIVWKSLQVCASKSTHPFSEKFWVLGGVLYELFEL